MSGTVQNNFEETDCLTTQVLKAFVSSDEKLEKITELFWDFATMGIKNNETEEKTDDLVREKFENTIKYKNRRYRVQLPEKEQYNV